MTEIPSSTTDWLAEATDELSELLDELRSGEVIEDGDDLPGWLMALRSQAMEIEDLIGAIEDGLYNDEFPST
jgi:hypothetical protein